MTDSARSEEHPIGAAIFAQCARENAIKTAIQVFRDNRGDKQDLVALKRILERNNYYGD